MLLFFLTELYLDGEEWNDGLLATIRERVQLHFEVVGFFCSCYNPLLKYISEIINSKVYIILFVQQAT